MGQAPKQRVIIRTYKGREASANAQFQRDAAELVAYGYYPTSQNWAQGSYGCADFLVALVLCVLIIGFIIFIYMLIVKPAGTLTVTYEFRDDDPHPVAAVQQPLIKQRLPSAAPKPVAIKQILPPPVPFAVRYFCYLNNEVTGPFDAATLKQMFFAGRLTAESLCCREGSAEWKSYKDI